MTTYAEIGARVEAAIAAGECLTVETDWFGVAVLTPADLAQEWADLAPGERFTIHEDRKV